LEEIREESSKALISTIKQTEDEVNSKYVSFLWIKMTRSLDFTHQQRKYFLRSLEKVCPLLNNNIYIYMCMNTTGNYKNVN
jgi:DNA phosphorothioation-dependent restriction protein DptG